MQFKSVLQEIYKKVKGDAKKVDALDKIVNKSKVFTEQYKTNACDCKSKVYEAANKKLLNYFNIDAEALYSKEKQKSTEKKELVKESFRTIVKENSNKQLKTKLNIVKFLLNQLPPTDQKFVTESIKEIDKLSKYNLKEAVNKLYKISKVQKSKLKEVFIDDKEESEEIRNTNSPGKEVKLKDLQYIKKISVEVPRNYLEPEKVIISFQVPLYPLGWSQQDVAEYVTKLKKDFDRLERTFINTCIYQKGFDSVFDPVGTIWDSMMWTTMVKPGSITPYKVDIYLNVNMQNKPDWKTCYETVYKMLAEFEVVITDRFDEALHKENQKQSIAARPKGRMRAERNPDRVLDHSKENNLKDEYLGYFN